MARVKGGVRSHAKHKKILKLAKGYRGSRNRLISRANIAVERSFEHAFEGRRQRRRDIRRLWITRISGALSDMGINYSKFIAGLNKADINLNRKMLSEMAIKDPKSFTEIVERVKSLTAQN